MAENQPKLSKHKQNRMEDHDSLSWDRIIAEVTALIHEAATFGTLSVGRAVHGFSQTVSSEQGASHQPGASVPLSTLSPQLPTFHEPSSQPVDYQQNLSRRFMARVQFSKEQASSREAQFEDLALRLFRVQSESVLPLRRLCQRRGVAPASLRDWREIPALPCSAFKHFAVTSLPPGQRSTVFHSSGTTRHQPSQHFHNPASLALYETSILPWFRSCFLPDADAGDFDWLILTPPPSQAPHSSLVHMFRTVTRDVPEASVRFLGRITDSEAWTLDAAAALAALENAAAAGRRVALLSTAFSLVHLLDSLHERSRPIQLPPGSRLLETGGYKGRSRSVSRDALHSMARQWLGLPETSLVGEYGMSEISSQAYDSVVGHPDDGEGHPRRFRFPPWARCLIVSAETGQEVADGQTGLLRLFDLANVRSALALQTDDLAIRRGAAFELVGRIAGSEPRGCSLAQAQPGWLPPPANGCS